MISKLRTLKGSAAVAALALGLVGCSQPSALVATSADNSGIIGGTAVTGTEDFAKTIVAIYNVPQGFICTGSILSDDTILTAAHCVVGDPTHSVVIFHKDAMKVLSEALQKAASKPGSITPDDLDKLPNFGPIRRGTEFRTTPVWEVKQNDMSNTGDMALMKFKGGLVEGFEKVSLLTDASKLADGQPVILSGYGTSDGVNKKGSGTLRVVETTIQNATYTKSEILIEQSLGKGACHGDSGGPAYTVIDGKKYLIGVTSRTVNDFDDHCSVSSAYTAVTFYADWIATSMTEMSKPKVDDSPELPLPPTEKAEEVPAETVANAS